jgi:hypothetical protein
MNEESLAKSASVSRHVTMYAPNQMICVKAGLLPSLIMRVKKQKKPIINMTALASKEGESCLEELRMYADNIINKNEVTVKVCDRVKLMDVPSAKAESDNVTTSNPVEQFVCGLGYF